MLQPVRIHCLLRLARRAQSVGDALHKGAKGYGRSRSHSAFRWCPQGKGTHRRRTGLQALGFLADNHGQRDQPSFLVASLRPGEVGWISMPTTWSATSWLGNAWSSASGRVNRRGGEDRQAEVVVLVNRTEKATDEALERIRAQRAPFGGALREETMAVSMSAQKPSASW